MSSQAPSGTPSETPSGSRGLFAGIAVAVVVVFVVLLAMIAPQSPIIDVPAADPAIASPPGTSSTITPTVTPFYDVVNDQPAAAGTFVKAEPIPGSPPGTAAQRFIYHSQDDNGNDTLVSGIYAAPTTPPPPGGFPVIGYAHGTTGSNRNCGISLTPFQASTPGYSAFITEILPLVKRGYAVAGTDYQGMGAPGDPMYLVGEIEGYNVLDSVRAVQNWRPEVDKSKTIIWGHSQGGHSAAFAAQIAPTYAPDLAIQGVAVLAPGLLPSLPLAVEGLLASDKPSGQTGFVMLIAASWAATYPDQIKPSDILTPAGIAKLGDVGSLCGGQEFDAFMDYPMSHYVKNPVPAAFYDLATENTPGGIPIKMPIEMVQGMQDTTIIPQLTLASNKQLCNMGDTVDFHIYPNDTHSSVMVNSADLIGSWMSDRLAGKPAPSNCSNQ